MLAEIFIVHAETLARARQETIPVSRSPFIPFDRSVQLKFKDSNASNSRSEIVDTYADQSLMSGANLNARCAGVLQPICDDRGADPVEFGS
jgi:hypothetical protein